MPELPSPPLSHNETLIKAVHDAYSAKAKPGADEDYSKRVAEAFGYTPEQLQSIPAESHMGLSCGNPVVAASIREGENVLDLGCGGGIDVLLAASKVGPNGQAIGLDISSDMVALARRNAQMQNLRPPQIAFVKTSLTEPLPISSNSIDCILSNCVINLLPLSGKASVLKEANRVLKPGGRIVLDDIIAKKLLPEEISESLEARIGCIAGAIGKEQYESLITDAGFTDVVFADTHGDLNIYYKAQNSTADCCSTETKTPCCSNKSDCDSSYSSNTTIATFDANEWVAAYQIYALKVIGAENDRGDTPTPLLRWWDAYPTPNSTPEFITNDEVASFLRDSDGERDFAVIDVRRNDHGGGHVRGSFQWPAQTFYDELPSFVEKFGKTEKVIFYCQSSNGRGPRCARWYQDYLNEIGRSESKAYVLKGGVVAWLQKFGDDAELVDKD